ncbi:hypothetical protein C8R45DRAFT_935685 [Mycena sanguinolenta]|nr:hypothetical protein C8R45DRAFT_935685 [Mycena sanguinolenta]
MAEPARRENQGVTDLWIMAGIPTTTTPPKKETVWLWQTAACDGMSYDVDVVFCSIPILPPATHMTKKISTIRAFRRAVRTPLLLDNNKPTPNTYGCKLLRPAAEQPLMCRSTAAATFDSSRGFDGCQDPEIGHPLGRIVSVEARGVRAETKVAVLPPPPPIGDRSDRLRSALRSQSFVGKRRHQTTSLSRSDARNGELSSAGCWVGKRKFAGRVSKSKKGRTGLRAYGRKEVDFTDLSAAHLLRRGVSPISDGGICRAQPRTFLSSAFIGRHTSVEYSCIHIVLCRWMRQTICQHSTVSTWIQWSSHTHVLDCAVHETEREDQPATTAVLDVLAVLEIVHNWAARAATPPRGIAVDAGDVAPHRHRLSALLVNSASSALFNLLLLIYPRYPPSVRNRRRAISSSVVYAPPSERPLAHLFLVELSSRTPLASDYGGRYDASIWAPASSSPLPLSGPTPPRFQRV